MEPERLISCIDFRYITDVLTPEEAIKILKEKAPTKDQRLDQLMKFGIAAYNTSVGWYYYSEDKIRQECRFIQVLNI